MYNKNKHQDVPVLPAKIQVKRRQKVQMIRANLAARQRGADLSVEDGSIWFNIIYSGLTMTSLESWFGLGSHPKIDLFQVIELFCFAQMV